MRASVLSPFFRLTPVITMAAVVAGLTVAVSAAPPVRPGPPARPTGTSVVSASARVRAGAMSTIITGSAWTSANAPIPGAQLQLRNIENGKVVAHAVADEAGRFAFTDLERGSYVVELVNDTGKVLAIGHMFSIAPGEQVATFVRLAAKSPWFSGFFGNSATAVTAVAASRGVTALAPVQLPLSAGAR